MSDQQSMFGDDINATDINSLTMPPHAAMSSKNDIGAPGPLEPPIYSPSVDMQQRRVTFDETPHIQEIPHRADLVADEDRRRVRSRDRDRNRCHVKVAGGVGGGQQRDAAENGTNEGDGDKHGGNAGGAGYGHQR